MSYFLLPTFFLLERPSPGRRHINKRSDRVKTVVEEGFEDLRARGGERGGLTSVQVGKRGSGRSDQVKFE